MLYVFHVDTGLMLTFDMNLAMESVSKLQEAISGSYNIPPDKQVMLISGGENLDPAARVCSYSAGTDTNPIFLFSRTTIESATPPSASVNYGSETDLQDQVEGSLNMGPTYETVVARAQLALQIHDVGREELRVCERLVHDQHLQHQGWAAVVANLEDITSAFKKRSEALWISFDEFIASHEQYTEMLENFERTMDLLGKIPLLPCLVGERHRLFTPDRNSAASSTPSDSTTAGSATAGSGSTLSINKLLPHDGSTGSAANVAAGSDLALVDGEASPDSLLEWISAQDSRNSMEQMIQQCQQGTQQFTEAVKEQLIAEMKTLLEAVNNPSMKEVKGLEDRLYGLEQLMYGARKLVQEQNEMAQGFVQNQNRASNLRDPSVLPDLCQSHKRQLLVMLKNHQSLRDIRRRCTAAKDELAANLHTRLRWIMYVEKSLCDKDNKLMIHQATLRKLKRRLAVLQQMADAPLIYARSVVEVVRRKAFSQQFLQWANTLANESLAIHEAEVGKREDFYCCLERHFLRSLFPGLDDVPVPYATKAPFAFDTKLPPITPDDINFLRNRVPELEEKLRIPEEDTGVDRLSEMTCKDGTSGPLGGLFTTLATTLQNTLQITMQTASQRTLKSSDQSLGEGDSQAPHQDQGPVGADSTDTASPGTAAAVVKDDMCTSDIVVLTHEMSVQAAEGGTLTDAGTVRLAPVIPEEGGSGLQQQGDRAKLGGPAEGSKPPASPARSDLNQSVEVLDEEDEEEEEEFLSLQAEVAPDSAQAGVGGRAGVVPAVPPTTLPQPVVVVEPKLKNSTSGSLAEAVPRGGSSGSLRTLAHSPTKPERPRDAHKQSTPETSPSLEEVNSEGFTTADFYIDESMPSSMTESPPTKKMVAELHMVLQDKSAQLDAKERDLEQHRRTLEIAREKLNRAEENLKVLHDTAEKGTLQLKCDVLSMEKQIARDKDEFSNYMESVAKKLLDVIDKFERQQSDEQKSVFDTMKQEKEKQIEELTEKLEIEAQKLTDAQDEIEIYHKQLKDRADMCDNLTSEMKNKVSEIQTQWRTEVEETRKELMLEHEIEIERSEAEYKMEMEKKETVVMTLTQTLKETEEKAQQKINEVTEKLRTEFENERKEILDKLENEYKEKKESLELEITELLKKQHQVELETKKEEHEQHLKSECDKLKAELAEEKRQEVDKLKEEFTVQLETEKQEWKSTTDSAMAVMEKENQKVLNDLHDSHTKVLEELESKRQQELSELEARHKELLAGVDRQHDQALADQAGEHQKALNDLIDTHQRQVVELREQLTLEKLNELQSLQQHLEDVHVEAGPPAVSGDKVDTSSAASGTVMTLEKHQEILAELKTSWESEQAAVLEQALTAQRRQHEAATERLIERLDKDKPDSTGSASSISAAAEKQTVFNEALSKVVAEKDKIIEDLKGREAALVQQREDDQRKLAEILSGKMGEDQERDAAVGLAREREEQLRQLKKAHEEELSAAQAQVRQLQEQVHMTTSAASSGSGISAASSPLKVGGPPSAPPSAPLSQSVFSQSSMASSIMPFSEPSCSVSMHERIQELETNLKTKEEEMTEMNRKLMQMSMSTSSRAFVQDKVSITTCNVGDVVLLCLDERHDHYVVFNMGTTLHFLHSDCLDTLGLKTSGAEARKSWVLAEITDKEYCQAKKAQNRFRVPLGTKFYRVKARAWDREAALQRDLSAQRDSPSKCPQH